MHLINNTSSCCNFVSLVYPCKNFNSLEIEVLGLFSISQSVDSAHVVNKLEKFFRVVFIIRGIGYRSQLVRSSHLSITPPTRPEIVLSSDKSSLEGHLVCCGLLQNQNTFSDLEFAYQKYLSVRVGYSYNLYIPVPDFIGVKISKKDRKLVIYGPHKQFIADFSSFIYNLRPPSVYTGRGIRFKKIIHRRKLGKKDIRKGRFF